jgi:hypothetical protein
MGAGAHMGEGGSMKGIVFSIEAMLSALILFIAIIFMSNMASIVSSPFSGFDQLRASAEDTAAIGCKTGAWALALPPNSNDSAAQSALAALPPSICARVELYNGSISIGNLAWSYSPANCPAQDAAASRSGYCPFVARRNSTSQELFYARVAAWPREG